ncbi:AAA family ATPase [Blautia sp.]|uniref:AAA family ATPase n=1 Tax=Blautia sp. TaxID=1955243 RepID=UPI002E75A5ED|nr:AAA family ATPase [Blautia sp.]MEE0809747.1 AAA family ATPase [Blautia sp.]
MKTVSIGLQDFGEIQTLNTFYIDKTHFIEEWWNTKDKVTLITRPRRFGKTLTMSMVEYFFSVEHKDAGLFENLAIWEKQEYRDLQGTYPVISISFSDIKENSFQQVRNKICEIIVDLYNHYDFLAEGELLNQREKEYFYKVSSSMEDSEISIAIRRLSGYLFRYYGKKVIILLDEYDTPVLEAYTGGYWQELITFTRSLFNATFKNNPYLERGIMTGITRISKESIFSDLNNLEVVTTTSEKYADTFGFTEQEVFETLENYGFADKKEEVKYWYDGFCFGSHTDIYNPWSIINYLDKKTVGPYWTNTSSNTLVGQLIQQGDKYLKETFEKLVKGQSIYAEIDEQIAFEQLDREENAIWSLLLASGYLKVMGFQIEKKYGWKRIYELQITNFEVMLMFRNMVSNWFAQASSSYNDFIKSLLQGDLKAMNVYMNRVALTTFSCFDTGKRPSAEQQPERFYHGFVLGLMVELEGRYVITSNRESGFGRYDVLLEPQNKKDYAIILEFKVFDPDVETSLEDTVQKALNQIEIKKYETVLLQKGIPADRIRKYGFAFCGKDVLIG